jgi:hypothetical protein
LIKRIIGISLCLLWAWATDVQADPSQIAGARWGAGWCVEAFVKGTEPTQEAGEKSSPSDFFKFDKL